MLRLGLTLHPVQAQVPWQEHNKRQISPSLPAWQKNPEWKRWGEPLRSPGDVGLSPPLPDPLRALSAITPSLYPTWTITNLSP